MKIGFVQLATEFGQPEQNKEKLAAYIEQASREGVDTLLFPELWDVGFFPENIVDLAQDSQNSFLLEWMKESAKQYNLNIVGGSIAVKEEGQLYNRLYVINRQGEVVYYYDKAHLFSPGNEQKYFTPGKRNFLFELDGIPCAAIICYDIRFTEMIRKKAIAGAQILFAPAQWAEPESHWVTLAKARAMENQMVVVAVNGCGEGGGLKSRGQSAIYDAWGETLVAAGEAEGLFSTDVNIKQVNEVRSKYPVFKDRRIDLYF